MAMKSKKSFLAVSPRQKKNGPPTQIQVGAIYEFDSGKVTFSATISRKSRNNEKTELIISSQELKGSGE